MIQTLATIYQLTDTLSTTTKKGFLESKLEMTPTSRMKFSAISILRCFSISKHIDFYVVFKHKLGNALTKYIDSVFESYIAVCNQKPPS